MSNKMLFRIVIVLVVTNIATLFLWKKDETFISSNKLGINILSNNNVATVNGTKISSDDWFNSMQIKYGKNHLKSMIDHEVVNQLAKKKKINIPEKIIERELSLLTTIQGIMTEDELEDQKKLWYEDVLFRYQLEALLTEGIQIPDKEIRTYYNSYAKQYDFPATVQLSHIIVENEESANKIVNELEKGALFSLLAEEYSLDEETKTDGGYLGFISGHAQFLPTIYYDTVSHMDANTFSDPVQVNDGVAIIYLHQSLPKITFTYEELMDIINNELALKKLGFTHSADMYWEDFDIEWIYDQ